MKALYYLSFNNYYNRIVKRYETIEEYLANGTLCGAINRDINFFPNDGISTQHTPYLNALEEIPDYLLVTEDGVIKSRWFVMECKYNAGKTQYICSLYRDLVAEYWNDVVDKPFYCEKGWLSVLDNGIFNDEAILTSQIKVKEHTLSDPTGIPWVVGYYAAPEANEQDKTIDYSSIEISPDVEVDTLSDWSSYGTEIRYCNDWNLNYVYRRDRLIKDDETWVIPFRTNVAGTPERNDDLTYGNWSSDSLSPSSFASYLNDTVNAPTYSNFQTLFANHAGVSFDTAALSSMQEKSGIIIKETSTGKYYEVVVNAISIGEGFTEIGVNTALGTQMRNAITSMSTMHWQASFNGTISQQNLRYRWSGQRYYYSYKAALLDKGTIKISKTRRPLFDAPYSMFCMPYGVLRFTVKDDFTPLIPFATSATFETTAMNAINIASAIAANTGGACYDIQLLPYCPLRIIREASPSLPYYCDLQKTNLIEGQDYSVALDNNNKPTQILFWVDQSSGQFTSQFNSNTFNTADLPTNATDFKVGCQTEFIRLCSPNYNGVFEMNPYKNRGIDYFTISYTYKPYQPFIQVSPNFKGLYGADYNDARGLILGGDFSLPIINDQWKTFEVQNKNYQSMFNRQIDNMEVQHKYQSRQELANAVTGTLSGGITGGIAGGVGGVGGAIAGAIAGTSASAVGGIIDVRAGEALRAEAMDYTRDLFGYQLDNIKALPNSLTRVSAYNIKNKIFPFIEVYDCTSEEKEAVRNKIIYNGMTVERIGTIEQFIGSQEKQYVKGQLIRFEGLTEDTHLLTTLSNELYKGVFV